MTVPVAPAPLPGGVGPPEGTRPCLSPFSEPGDRGTFLLCLRPPSVKWSSSHVCLTLRLRVVETLMSHAVCSVLGSQVLSGMNGSHDDRLRPPAPTPGFLAPSHTLSLLVSGFWLCVKGAESMALLGGPGPGL